MMRNSKSIIKKIKTISKSGIDPIIAGKRNYEANIPEIEKKARERYEKIKENAKFVPEPIDMFRVTDERIPELSNMMWDDCGCAMPYLLRQDIKIYKEWSE